MRLLLLEDDDTLGDGLRDFLRSEYHVVEWFAATGDARAFQNEPFDLLLVGWNLPDGSGIEWQADLRRRGKNHTGDHPECPRPTKRPRRRPRQRCGRPSRNAVLRRKRCVQTGMDAA